ncbi:hypothetical protein, partial [Vibrio caribbeanicus]|uniref:hypothetical protein n=1 Tax=Vibrio caribbeanicus TaxID=701175 RepID=UPI0030DCBA44
ALWERATVPISSSNNLVRVHYYAALFSLNSTLWHRSESCILKSLGYIRILDLFFAKGRQLSECFDVIS